MSQTLAKLISTDLSALRPRLALSAEASVVLDGCTLVPDALERLEAAGLLNEAAKLVANALPKREAVWWACMCSGHTAPAALPEADRLARESAEQWVRQQTDAARRQAMVFAEQADFASPEAWVGVAAFWSGDSLAPEGQAAVPPAPHLYSSAVAGAIALAAVRGNPLNQSARLKRFLESGRNIAAGGPGRLPLEEV